MDGKFLKYSLIRQSHWNQVAQKKDSWNSWGRHYHHRLTEVINNIIPPNSKILEIGCGTGQLLASLDPSIGIGIDFSQEMIKRAKIKHPELHFITADAHYLPIKYEFDYIVLSDLLNDIWDIQQVLENLHQVLRPDTKVVINFFSRLWQPILSLARIMKLATPMKEQNWITVEDSRSLLQLTNFETIHHWREILFPQPLLNRFFNKFLVKLWPFYYLALTNLIVARPKSHRWDKKKPPSVSVVIPARNEIENIEQIFQRIPHMGSKTELVFVEGHSTDGTYKEIKEKIIEHKNINAKLIKQKGEGKGNAVRLGFSKASGDIFMILDADLTVPPEDLVRFYQAIFQNKGEFINGVRLVYPMENEAMRSLNLIGNKLFSIIFSWLLGQNIRDTLCGTKVLWKKDYEIIERNRSYFGTLDPFGDFDLIFGASKLNLKYQEIPIRYRERGYGKTNIKRWSHGLLLLRMVAISAKKIKFI